MRADRNGEGNVFSGVVSVTYASAVRILLSPVNILCGYISFLSVNQS
jgi:hypothetical protein